MGFEAGYGMKPNPHSRLKAGVRPNQRLTGNECFN